MITTLVFCLIGLLACEIAKIFWVNWMVHRNDLRLSDLERKQAEIEEKLDPKFVASADDLDDGLTFFLEKPKQHDGEE